MIPLALSDGKPEHELIERGFAWSSRHLFKH
jgi:hypothetical protein